MVRQRTKNACKELADEDDALAAANGLDQLVGGFAAKLRLQDIVKILYAEEVQGVAADAAKQSVKEASGKRAAGKTSKSPGQHQTSHARAPGPAFGKTLRVAGEKANRAHGAKFDKGAFHAPIGNRASI